jgi:hypothetical protein
VAGLGTGRVGAGDGGTAGAEDAGARVGVGEGARAGPGDGGRAGCAPPAQPASTATATAHRATRQAEPTVTIPRYPADMPCSRAERPRSPAKARRRHGPHGTTTMLPPAQAITRRALPAALSTAPGTRHGDRWASCYPAWLPGSRWCASWHPPEDQCDLRRDFRPCLSGRRAAILNMTPSGAGRHRHTQMIYQDGAAQR